VGTAHSRWSASYLYGVTASQAPQITVQTTVGSQFSIDGKLRAQARTFYVDGRTFGGDIHADATARIVVLDIPAGVTLESFSGMVYPVVPAN
jgi:cytoskeletal protein CcmA (bactofilin family)